ncbi:L,D-transpeptidase family protein [Gordonia hydrophobica]|uniref:L,D-transpeptidase family protein n=1 Tax=Gordonia hydrophobica TaxID=40516 RepID=A0ABZ2U2A7_9ACTN|nr:L,D-transpeptidase family protein [Gordonia hydrophobica]
MLQLGFALTALLGALVVGAGQAAAVPQTAPQTGSGSITTLIDNLLKGLTTPGAPAVPGAAETSQMIVVTAPVASSQTATLTGFEKDATGTWKPVLGPTKAYLGEKGMGKAQDNVYRTPQGTFPMNIAFGRQDKPEGTKMEYFKTTTRDWWDSNEKSPTYNTHVVSDTSPGGDSENLYNSGPVYDYAVNINHNPTRTPGDASAIFLHVTDGKPTQGCVAIARDEMVKVLQWLDPAKNPQITIGVNVDAPKDAPSAQQQSLPGADVIGGVVGNLADLIPSVLAGSAS